MTLEDIEKLLRSRGVKAVHLASAQRLSSRSKLGGLPEVPRDFTWPVWEGRPLSFVAQIDLSTLPPLETLPGLPAQGLLYFFYDQEESPWGYDPKDLGGWRVLYCPDPSALSIAAAPPGLKGDFIYKEKQVGPRAISSFPDFGSLGPSVLDSAVAAVDVEYQLRSAEFAGEPEHQIGGFPHPIQGDEMELEAQLASNGLYCGNSTGYQDPRARVLAEGAKDWRLLLQVDDDSDTDMMWGDGGRLYFWIRAQDLAQRDFSKVWMILQCF